MHKPTTSNNKTPSRKIAKRSWERPPVVVAKRNARERTRVHAVNQAFITLKHHLPAIRCSTKRVSKLKILRAAINYIDALTKLLQDQTDISKPNASTNYFNNTISNPSRFHRQNYPLAKDVVSTIEDQYHHHHHHHHHHQQQQQQSIKFMPHCYYNTQYWLNVLY